MWIICENPDTAALGGHLPTDDGDLGERFRVEFDEDGRGRTRQEVGEHLVELYPHAVRPADGPEDVAAHAEAPEDGEEDADDEDAGDGES